MLKITHRTFELYQQAVDKFLTWAKEKGRSLATHRNVDDSMCIYLRHLCADGCSLTYGNYAVFGWIKLKSNEHMDSRLQLPFAREALKGWRSRFPGHTRTGIDLTLWDLVALHAVHKGYYLTGAAILIQGDSYMRPGELFEITKNHIISPTGSRVKGTWGVVIGLLELGKPTKAGEYDDVVIFNTSGRSDVNDVLRALSRRRLDSSSCVFAPLTLEQYGKQITECAKVAGLDHLQLTPHCLRHSGASHDAYHKIRDVHEIQSRGRWKSAKSVHRYKKPGRMLLSQAQVPAAVWNQAIKARPKVLKEVCSRIC